MRRVGGEDLLAGLTAHHRVRHRDGGDANGHCPLATDGGDHPGQGVLLQASACIPLGEPAGLAVVAVVGHAHLGTDMQDLAVKDEDAAVVAHVLVDHGHADVAQDAVGEVAGQQRGDRLPAVQDGVALVKVVLAAVPGDLELGTAAVARTAGLCDADGLLDALQVAGEVHRPLVEVAGGHGEELGVDEQVERTVLRLLLLGGGHGWCQVHMGENTERLNELRNASAVSK